MYFSLHSITITITITTTTIIIIIIIIADVIGYPWRGGHLS